MAAIAETEASYQAAITQADQYFTEEDWEQARVEYQNASQLKPEETYPADRLNEIVKIEKELAEKKVKYDKLIASGDAHFNAENFHEAKNSYAGALELFPVEPYPQGQIREVEAIILAELERIKKEYNKAISEGDRHFASKIYDNAIQYYNLASQIKPDEAYPKDQIAEITRMIEENVVVDLINTSVTIENNGIKKYDFDPVPRQGRKESYVIIKAENKSDNDFRLFLNYGKGGSKNGGFVINIPKSTSSRSYVIRMGGQYKWSGEDNNWLSLQPEGGSLQISMFQISQE
nr:hypothetical protein [Bacteroidota bacterium]